MSDYTSGSLEAFAKRMFGETEKELNEIQKQINKLNNTMITFEQFKEEFYGLLFGDRLAIYNEYCSNENYDDRIEPNEEYAIREMFEDTMDALRAAQYGEYNVCDEYFKLDGCGNLESFDALGAMEHIEEHLDDIYDEPKYWKDYIDPCFDDEDDREPEEDNEDENEKE